MAYRFNGSTDNVEFAIAPLTATYGAFTVAALVKRGASGGIHTAQTFSNSAFTSSKTRFRFNTDKVSYYDSAWGTWEAGSTLTSTSLWYIIVASASVPANDVLLHSFDGTTWSHNTTGFGSGAASNIAVGSSDRLHVGTRVSITDSFNGDIVCVGFKKAASTNLQIETLSRTAWTAWTAFGFDWLIGFTTGSPFVSGGVLKDQASPGTGNQIAISGTSVVSDPAGWAWTSSSTWNGSSTVSLTDTITTAGTRLGVTVHGATTTAMTATVTTVSRAVTLHASTAVSETVTVTTVGLERLPLVPRTPGSLALPQRSPGSLVLVPRPPDSLVLTPR